jgi:pyruvate dehydrogenase E2 component (dihydrolipoamide acetyltransferase)
MPEVSLRIPQIGEGLQEARLVAVLKQPGDFVKRDEPIYQMETDKAVMDVESPYEGTLTAWLANVDDVLAIGAEVASMDTSDEVQEASGHGPAPAAEEAVSSSAAVMEAPRGERRRDVPPRTRAYAKQKGLTDAELENVTASGSKLMPEDIDAWMSGSSEGASSGGAKFSETPLSGKQRLLASRLVRGSQLSVPGTMTVCMNWEPIEALRNQYKDMGGDFQPSVFTLFAYAVAQATKEFPGFRSTIVGDTTVRTYDHIQLGIAVALPGDALVLAVVEDADTLSWTDFANKCRAQIALARDGQDQANESVTLNLTNMQAHGIRDAVAVVVPPGICTIFLGEPYWGLDQQASELKRQRQANLGITFDHRLINGVGAALFQNAVKANVEGIAELVKA